MVFKEITRDRFKAFRARIRVEAVEVVSVGDQGSAKDADSKVLWTYEEPAQTLKLICTESPWWMTNAAVEARMRSLMEGVCG